MNTTKTIIGIHCYIHFTGEPRDDVNYYYISFSEWEDDATHDIHGVPDDEIFYYFEVEETNALMRAIANDHETFQVSDDWKIVLSLGHELEYNDYSEVF